jgi:hypothetical protein
MQNSNTLKVNSKIVGFEFLGSAERVESTEIESMETLSENTKRPIALNGKTYKLRSPVYEAALYITINDLILNQGTDQETKRPFEIFINSKAMESFQWIVSLTRMISAVFRKGGDVTFIVDELKSVCDPRGGYWKHGKYVPSIVAEIGMVVEDHLIDLGLIKAENVEKGDVAVMHSPPVDKVLAKCPKCGAPALARESGCDKCLNCSWSKCS